MKIFYERRDGKPSFLTKHVDGKPEFIPMDNGSVSPPATLEAGEQCWIVFSQERVGNGTRNSDSEPKRWNRQDFNDN